MSQNRTYRYRYTGEAPVYTVNPLLDWQPGEAKTVETPINHPLFVPEAVPERRRGAPEPSEPPTTEEVKDHGQ